MIAMVSEWVRDFPVVSIEDALDEEDWSGWRQLTARLGTTVQLVGDDLFTTNGARVRRGIDEAVANGVLVKVNQNGTLSGSLDVIRQSRTAGYAPVVSARSGETEDPFIADLAVGTAAGQIKIGSLRCGERLAKYNQLLRIEEQSRAPFAGAAALAGRR
jgi:enolase